MYLLLIFCCLSCCLHADDYKQMIAQYKLELEQSANQPDLLVKLAIAYHKDQQQENSLKTFVKALECVEQKSCVPLAPKEQALYEEALALYLKENQTPQETAITLIEHFSISIEKSPNNYGLGFVMAASYANLHMYEDFFDCFHQAYQLAPDHFLAHKILAILYLKLFEMSRTLEEREVMRAKIEEHAGKASEIYPRDTSLHKFVIQFAADKNTQVERVLKKIIRGEASIARSDIPFYVQKAIEAKKFELAQEFIDKMREQYHYSRMLSLAQERLDESKGE